MEKKEYYFGRGRAREAVVPKAEYAHLSMRAGAEGRLVLHYTEKGAPGYG